MSTWRNVHWMSPVTMMSSFLAGILLAVVHHIFNLTLAGTVVVTEQYRVIGLDVSQQQINTAVGTTLAFLSRACLVVALSTAYTQLSWCSALRTSHGSRIGTLNTVFSALDNVWNLLRLNVWRKRPCLFLLALITWLVPTASVITPATISIITAPVLPAPSELTAVPQADFTSLKFMAPGLSDYAVEGSTEDADLALLYGGPNYVVQWISFTASTGGQILQITPPSPNASWALNFHGPSLRCDDVNATFREQIESNILLGFRNGTGCQHPYNFLAWTAAAGFTSPGFATAETEAHNDYGNYVLPFSEQNPSDMNTGTLGPLNYLSIGKGGTADPGQVATIYFAVVPKLARWSQGECGVETADSRMASIFNESTILQCQLYNASYQTGFSYVNGQQSIDIETNQLNAVNTLAGYYISPNDTCPALNANFESCTIDPAVLQRLSYQSVMDAFGQVFVGSVLSGQNSRFGQSFVAQTSVLSTLLMRTKELSFLRRPSIWSSTDIESPDSLIVTAEMQSLYDWTQDAPGASLQSTLEELFTNITISLMSSAHFHPNISSPFAPPLVNVTAHDYHNIYAYAATKLWLAYGLAIAFTGIGVLLGLAAVLMHGASFSYEFSTILRATRNADISVPVRDADCDAVDPLPKYLGEATITFEAGRLRSRRTDTHAHAQTKPGFAVRSRDVH